MSKKMWTQKALNEEAHAIVKRHIPGETLARSWRIESLDGVVWLSVTSARGKEVAVSLSDTNKLKTK